MSVKNKRMPSVMSHLFSLAPKSVMPRSTFDTTSGLKTTFNAGYLYPIHWKEILPADTQSLDLTGFIRMSTPIYPIMDNLFIDCFTFFVPNRLVWSNFVKMMGEQDNPSDSIDYEIPTISRTGFTVAEEDIGDYFGLPLGAHTTTGDISALPFRCYNRIWNEFFRDQNIQNSVTENTGDTSDSYSDYALLKRGKRHDYFTSCLPWPQKGTAVSMPLGSSAPVTGIGKFNQNFIGGGPYSAYETDGSGTSSYANASFIDGTSTNASYYVEEDPNNTGYPNIRADLSSATAATINSMRLAVTTQQFLELDARSGTRYTEFNYAHFGVTNPDLRLQRPELIQYSSTPIQSQAISALTSVPSGTANGSMLGDVGGVMTGTFSHKFTKSYQEHGYTITLLSVRADLNYFQGVERFWSRRDRLDHYFPTFAHLGEQAVLNKEIYHQDTTADDDVFGYQEQWAEYKYGYSHITGAMRPDHSLSLEAWHLAQEFGSLPALDSTFIEENPPMSRVLADATANNFIGDFYKKERMTRVMPVYSVPGLNRF